MGSDDAYSVCVIPFHAKFPHRIQQQIRALDEDGHDIVAYRWDRGGPFDAQSDALGFETRSIELSAPESGALLLLYLPLYYLKLYLALREESFDVFHCVHFFVLPFSLFVGQGDHVVYESREMFPRLYARYAPGRFQPHLRSLLQWVENRLVARVDHVFTVDSVEDAIERRYRRVNDNVTVVYNVPDIDIAVDESRVEALSEEYTDAWTLVYVGGIMWEKGSLRMLEVVDELRGELDVRLLLIGRFKNAEAEARAFIEDNDLGDVVETVGWLPFEEMLCYLYASDVALALHQPTDFYLEYPSKGTGAKFFNYMQASLPIVAPEFGEIGDVVRETDCGVLVDTTDTTSVAEDIVDLVADPESLERMGERGRRAVEETYNWDVEKRKVLTGYDTLGE